MSILVASQPIFQRAMRVISTITNENPAIVLTTTDHQYITGMIVRLNIPKGYGMQQANQLSGEITKLTTATTKQKVSSLRTVVPMNIVRHWQLKKGDLLDWDWKVIDGKMNLIVSKVNDTKK